MTQAAILAASGSPGTTTGFKNRIINGAMVIDQRNNGASVTPTTLYSTYCLDRWVSVYTTGSKFSVQQVSTAPVGFVNSQKFTSAGAYSVPAAELYTFQQYIEGYNIADLGWGTANAKTVTLSFWVQSSLTGTFGGSLNNAVVDRSYPFSYTISAANTWEYKTITVVGDTTGTWATNNTNGLALRFALGVGSNYTGTAGSWSGNVYYAPTGATNILGTSGATFYITGVQLEVGTTATNFDFRSYGTELALCQRYYTTFVTSVSQALWWNGYQSGGQNSALQFFHPVTMRATPTLTNVGTWYINNMTANTPTGSFASPQSSNIYLGVTSTGTCFFFNNPNSGITLSAEL